MGKPNNIKKTSTKPSKKGLEKTRKADERRGKTGRSSVGNR